VRLSRYFLPTSKNIPSDAHLISHKLMLQTAMIHQISAGIYAFSPVALRVLKKIEAIIRDEQDKIGGLELLMPTIQPASLWKESGRYEDYGQELLRFPDRHKNEMLFGPTGEEVLTDFFKTHVKSYKDLPKRFYQIQWKFRDEIRPRFGIMRGREFLMKDLYSFDLDKESALSCYKDVVASYYNIFHRMNLKVLAVRADTGPIGGDLSHEFVVLAPYGESDLVYDSRLSLSKALSFEELQRTYAVADDQFNPETCPLPEELRARSKGIEIGHVFYFGTKYSQPLGATVMGPEGDQVPVYMGSYGIGVTRLLATLIEVFHDEKGMVWPASVSPFDVSLLNLKMADDAAGVMADRFYQEAGQAGYDVLYDDRLASPGFKLKDADLVGMPYQVIVGEKALREGLFELKERHTGHQEYLSLEACLNKLLASVK